MKCAWAPIFIELNGVLAILCMSVWGVLWGLFFDVSGFPPCDWGCIEAPLLFILVPVSCVANVPKYQPLNQIGSDFVMGAIWCHVS